MAKQNLLVVDDDPRSRRVLEVTLRNAGYVVATAADGLEALARLEASPPALVLSDTEMPGLDGYELCRRLKADERLKDVPFLFLAEKGSVEAKIQGLELGADDYLTKPIYIKEVLARVRIALQKRERAQLERKEKRRFFGSLEDMGVIDLLTTVELGRKTGSIRFDRPPQQARLWFQDGRVIDAEVGRLTGEDAVYRMLTWDAGDFEMDFGLVDREPRVTASTQQLLMEGMRRMDEWGRMLEQLPSIETVFQVDYAELSERLAELPDEVNGLLRLFDGHRTALQAIDDSGMPDLEALAAISRLYFEGIIYEVGGERAAAERPAEERGELRSWLSDMMQPAADPEPEHEITEADLADFGEASALPGGLVDELLTSAAAIPRVRPIEPEDSGGALPLHLEFPPGGGLPPEPAAPALRPEATPPSAEEDPRRVRDALQAPASPPPMELGHDQFFDRSDGESLARIEDESRREPVSKMAFVVLGVGVVALIAAVLFFALRDEVKPREEPHGVLDSVWPEEVLKARAAPAAVPAVDASWQLASSDAGAPPAPASVAKADEDAPPAPASAAPASAAPASEAVEAVPARPETQARFEDLLREGLGLYGKGDYGHALTSFEKALGLRPASEEALIGYANTLLELDRGAEAQRAAEKVVRINPRNARAHLIIGTVRQDAGDRAAAIAAYQKYLELAPDDRYAEQVRWIMEHRLR
jgi:CheY-like chemotaxis protein/tetratricopeptide (TPR) repeat protein